MSRGDDRRRGTSIKSTIIVEIQRIARDNGIDLPPLADQAILNALCACYPQALVVHAFASTATTRAGV
jgi:hypothetical protein